MKQRIIFAGLMSLMLSSMMTGWVTWINLGFSGQFFFHWGNAFIVAWPAAAIIAFTISAKLQKISIKLANW